MNSTDRVLKSAPSSCLALSRSNKATVYPSLEERSAEKHVVPLKALIDEFRSSGLAMLLSDLKMGGFGEASIRETKELWISFSNAVKKAQETTASDLPWLILRGLAIEINNEMNEPLATKAILDGMNSFAERNVPLNIVAGWTFLGWVVALVWASTQDVE